MDRISFKTKSKNGLIVIPEKYKELSNSVLNVTISKNKKKNIKLKKIKITNPYRDITDSKKLERLNAISDWQRKTRDEWE